jgi:hypothetical protein
MLVGMARKMASVSAEIGEANDPESSLSLKFNIRDQ